MNQVKCPLCGQTEKCTRKVVPSNYVEVKCDTYHVECFIDEDFLDMEEKDDTKEKGLDLIVEHLLRSPLYNANGYSLKWAFFYDPSYQTQDTDKPFFINMAERIGSYPETVTELTDRALINLSIRHPDYGDYILPFPQEKRIVFDHNGSRGAFYGIHEMLEELGLLKTTASSHKYKITAKGWQRISELKHKEKEIRQGFIAMSFSEDARPIREAIKQAIKEAGYAVYISDEKEHNNQIVPEMFFEIQRSKFVVIDVTYPNFGAYYEAGYAQALDKQVIICCRKAEHESPDKNKRPHFDIAQKQAIVWETETQLIEKLKRRIDATVK